MSKIWGGIEAGGTSVVCGLGSEPGNLRTVRLPTTSPEETVSCIVSWFEAEAPLGLEAVGIASFGPADIDKRSPKWGHITNTPKPGWRDFDFAGAVGVALGVRVEFDTDVNGALRGEMHWGAARGVSSCLYLTVGTGIGGAALCGGRILHGLLHPEMGHIRVPHGPDGFAGVCPFHVDCLEGLASGPAIAARWGAPGEELTPDHPAWKAEAEYLAQALATYCFVLVPQRILLGGGVMRQASLFPPIRTRLSELLAGYLPLPDILAPELGDEAGVLGAMSLVMPWVVPRVIP